MRFVLPNLAIAMALAFASRACAQPASITSEQEPVGRSASGVPILHPLSRRTYAAAESGRTLEVPEMMVHVPAGPCTIGSGAAAKTATLDSYCIGKYSVTNAEYKEFLDVTGTRNRPRHWSNGKIPENKGNHPV